ncbi:MAG: ATP-binding protein, partial [Myxococcales bacterium]|nr:ATP-binding protein [Myxococcales bacterium]
MLAIAHAGCLVGIEAHPVEVEVQLGRGLPGFDIVGLPERGVRESRVRVKAALHSSGYSLPPRHLVLNLAPGDLRKTGSGFDLAIAVSVLAACGLVSTDRLATTLLAGELSLSGGLRHVPGVLAQLRSARERGLETAIIPEANAAEGALIDGIDVHVANELRDVVEWLCAGGSLRRAGERSVRAGEPGAGPR